MCRVAREKLVVSVGRSSTTHPQCSYRTRYEARTEQRMVMINDYTRVKVQEKENSDTTDATESTGEQQKIHIVVSFTRRFFKKYSASNKFNITIEQAYSS